MNIKINRSLTIVILMILGTFIFIFSQPAMVQNQSYHQFVDSRAYWGIPNALDVITNILFLIVGFLGIKEVKNKAWKWLFISILLVAPGSAYYHWSPSNETLLWDRLPMSMGFMALYVILLSEHISLKFERYLYPALLLGILSVLTWYFTSDLRFYFWIQFSSFVTIPIILFLFPSRFDQRYWFLVALLFYGLAKWAELKDHAFYFASAELISGHSLKHILAAIGLFALWWMVRVRKENAIAFKPEH